MFCHGQLMISTLLFAFDLSAAVCFLTSRGNVNKTMHLMEIQAMLNISTPRLQSTCLRNGCESSRDGPLLRLRPCAQPPAEGSFGGRGRTPHRSHPHPQSLAISMAGLQVEHVERI
jgi:hypothetical protein